MNKEEIKKEVIKYWWQKSIDSLESAKRELLAGNLSYAINRIYYSAFYAVSTCLLDKNLTFKKHSGVRTAFHIHFIKSSLLNQDYGKFYDQLFEDRQEGDYIEFTQFEKEYVENRISFCKKFLDAIAPFISTVNIFEAD